MMIWYIRKGLRVQRPRVFLSLFMISTLLHRCLHFMSWIDFLRFDACVLLDRVLNLYLFFINDKFLASRYLYLLSRLNFLEAIQFLRVLLACQFSPSDLVEDGSA